MTKHWNISLRESKDLPDQIDWEEPWTLSIRVDGKGGFPIHAESLEEWLKDCLDWTARMIDGQKEKVPEWRLYWIGPAKDWGKAIEVLHEKWQNGELSAAGVVPPNDY